MWGYGIDTEFDRIMAVAFPLRKRAAPLDVEVVTQRFKDVCQDRMDLQEDVDKCLKAFKNTIDLLIFLWVYNTSTRRIKYHEDELQHALDKTAFECALQK